MPALLRRRGDPVLIRTRFAPSPTGDLHLGGAWTALASWLLARRSGGRTALRMEDLDAPRVRPGAAARILEDLAWLGLAWDEGPREGGIHASYTQSERLGLYADALEDLRRRGLVYACDCSRKEIGEASAPHGRELVYPGTCRGKPATRAFRRDPALRLRVPEEAEIAFMDRIRGSVTEDVSRDVGDFVLRRADGLFAYQLAVVVDDWKMEITDVVRGDDLLASTARQILLGRLLGAPEPAYWHVPLVVMETGERLEKRAFPRTVRQLRDSGVDAREIVGLLAEGLGFTRSGEPVSPDELARRREPWTPRTEPWKVPARLLG